MNQNHSTLSQAHSHSIPTSDFAVDRNINSNNNLSNSSLSANNMSPIEVLADIASSQPSKNIAFISAPSTAHTAGSSMDPSVTDSNTNQAMFINQSVSSTTTTTNHHKTAASTTYSYHNSTPTTNMTSSITTPLFTPLTATSSLNKDSSGTLNGVYTLTDNDITSILNAYNSVKRNARYQDIISLSRLEYNQIKHIVSLFSFVYSGRTHFYTEFAIALNKLASIIKFRKSSNIPFTMEDESVSKLVLAAKNYFNSYIEGREYSGFYRSFASNNSSNNTGTNNASCLQKFCVSPSSSVTPQQQGEENHKKRRHSTINHFHVSDNQQNTAAQVINIEDMSRGNSLSLVQDYNTRSSPIHHTPSLPNHTAHYAHPPPSKKLSPLVTNTNNHDEMLQAKVEHLFHLQQKNEENIKTLESNRMAMMSVIYGMSKEIITLKTLLGMIMPTNKQ